MITDLWTVTRTADNPMTIVEHHTDCEVPENEVRYGVKEVAINAYGDTLPPNALIRVTAASPELAQRVLDVVVAAIDLNAWWAAVKREDV